MKRNMKRFLALMMAFAVAMTTVLTSDVTTAYAASSSKTVKSVTLKIGTKNVTKKTTTMYVKDTATVKVTVNPSKAKKSVTFKSNKTSVATVSSKGKITAKKAGTAKVTVTVKGKDNKSKSTYVNVKVQNRPVKSVKLSATKISLKKGASKTLKATVSPSNATVKTVKWSSNKTSVATVDSKGKVTAKAAGTAVITAKSGSKSAKCTVVVTDDTPVSVPVTGVTISQPELILAVNATSSLKATVTPDNATNKEVKWSSSDASVATVDNNGNVKGVASGTAKISVTTVDGKFSAECNVTVKDSISVTGVTLSKTSLDIEVNATSSLTATVTPDNAANKAVTWSSANPAVATVDQSGKVKGVTAGTTTIKVTTTEGGFSAECTVNVKAVSVPVTGVTIQSELILAVNATSSIKAIVTPDNATNKEVVWSSSDASVATVDNKGDVKGIAPGTAKISVTTVDGGFSAECVVTVKDSISVTGVTISKTSLDIEVNATSSLTATVAPDNAANKAVTWSSANPAVATVDQNGSVKGITAGTTTIKVTTIEGGFSAECTVNVKAGSVSVTGVAISQPELILAVNATSPLKATVSPDDAANKEVKWSSSDDSVATVDNDGNVKGVASGTAKISVTTVDGGFSAECNVTVKDSISVTGVTISKTSLDVAVNATSSLAATVAPDNAVNKAVTWSSVNPAVATVDQNGNVKGVTVGTTTVRVTTTEGGFSAECTVNVKAATNKNASKVEIEITNDIDGYENAVFTGTDAHVRVRALDEDGSPVGNTEVKLDATCQKLGNGDGMFGIRSDDVVKTDADGYVTFVFGLLPQYSKYTAVDQYCESYLLKATVVGSSVNSTTTLSFGYIDLRGTVVENNRDLDNKNDIIPSDNAVAGDDGIFNTHSTNGFRVDEYVNSQQVSRKGTDEHAVRISAAPYLVIPSTAGDISSEYYVREINATSSDYSVYNDISNESTTTVIKGVPAGLQYATLNFSNVKLSEYTKIDIQTYNSVTGGLIKSYQMFKDSNTNDIKTTANYQLPIQKDVDIDVVVSIVSEGQVNDDLNDGYTIKDITGLWASTSGKRGVYKELEGTVTWEKVDTSYSNLVDITLEDVRQYIPEGSKYLDEKYTYKYEVPVFPYTGDAIITVNDANKGVVAYYLYPTVNDYKYVVNNRGEYVFDDFGDYVKEYQNKNVLPTNKKLERTNKNYYDEYEGAIGILASAEEINYAKSVGDITTDGNDVIVNSYVSGITGLKADVKVDGLTYNQLNPTNGSVLYTSVNWAPIPNEELEADDFYALLGQNVTVNAQLLDYNGNVVKESGKTIDFTYNTVKDGTKITASDIGKVLGETGVTLVQGTKLTTDENGQAKLILKSSDYSKFITNIQAQCERFNVKITIGSQEKGTEKETKLANIYWVDAGLQFADKVEAESKEVEPIVWNSWTNTNVELEDGDIDNRSVGSHWIFGYRVVGRIKIGDNEERLGITDIPVNISKDSLGEMDLEGCGNGVAKLYSEKIGTTRLTGEITNESFDVSKLVVFTISKGIETKEYPNVGEGTPTIKSSLTIPVSWTAVGLDISIVSPLGTALDKNTSTYVYIKLADKFGNPISSRNVTYSITGLNATEGVIKEATDDKGLIPIELKSPSADWTKEAYTTTITASTDEGQISADSLTLQYSESKATKFGLVNAEYDADRSIKGEKDVIVATFSVPVRVINKALFTVRYGNTIYEVTSAEIDSKDARKVVLTLGNNAGALGALQTASDIMVSVADEAKDNNDGMIYKAVDSNGTTLTPGYTDIKFVRQSSFGISAEYSDTNENIRVTIMNGPKNISFKASEVVAVSDVPSVFTVDGTEMGIVKGIDGEAEVDEIYLDAKPTDKDSTVRIYYNGVMQEVTVKAATK